MSHEFAQGEVTQGSASKTQQPGGGQAQPGGEQALESVQAGGLAAMQLLRDGDDGALSAGPSAVKLGDLIRDGDPSRAGRRVLAPTDAVAAADAADRLEAMDLPPPAAALAPRPKAVQLPTPPPLPTSASNLLSSLPPAGITLSDIVGPLGIELGSLGEQPPKQQQQQPSASGAPSAPKISLEIIIPGSSGGGGGGSGAGGGRQSSGTGGSKSGGGGTAAAPGSPGSLKLSDLFGNPPNGR
ncbi:hypothetical protein GPECTOR_17g963 [Gonium pectorale]|uniref:Uncharacterized protein n=1 Tax=Gonium pectorale TaxID=33097 RepID=A0A150GKK9_GONPE|nr:hypothetical protein GPECTOR_17g963 [Gonium pectorale]|eukprot:KXZ50324.1 hypothetical protein GPECTOR_17g963 [Gonium pectorale]